METQTLKLRSEHDLVAVARTLAPGFRVGQIVLLQGPLGAGKTTMVRALCRALGVPAEVGIRSPTFTLINEVDGGEVPIVHADFYRVMDDAEVLDELGFWELCERSLAFVEWGASLPQIADHASVVFTLNFVSRSDEFRTLGIDYLARDADTWEPLLNRARESL